jgi:hypothetical protein
MTVIARSGVLHGPSLSVLTNLTKTFLFYAGRIILLGEVPFQDRWRCISVSSRAHGAPAIANRRRATVSPLFGGHARAEATPHIVSAGVKNSSSHSSAHR